MKRYKRYSYTASRSALFFTGIIFWTQIITEIVGTRKPEFWWVLPATGAVFACAVLYAAVLVILNARMK